MNQVIPGPRPALSLLQRREALLSRIHDAREATAVVGRHLIVDLRTTERTRRSMLGGLRILKASMIAAGVIWSLNAPSTVGRGRRLFTIALSLLSTLRALRKAGTFFIPLAPSPRRQG